MRKTLAVFVVAAMALLGTFTVVYAQDKDAAPDTAKAATPDKAQSDRHNTIVEPYRLDFSFSEFEDGKKVNTRHYSMSVTAGSADEMKIGSRVPVAVGEGGSVPPQYQYLDLGTNIWANLRPSGEDLQLEIRSEISWTKHEDVDVSPRAPHTAFTPPIVSQIKINGSTLLQTGKPMVIGAADDPYSNREFQLEVTATKLR